ncbi:MAG: glycine--tRNA ligase subunit beta [Gammaproteobacteria bacterium]
MAERADFLVEIGTEELPPKALKSLSQAFHDRVVAGLADARLAFGDVESFATPRRLALRVSDLQTRQDDQALEMRGPPTRVGLADGQYTKAAVKFAESSGVPVDELVVQTTDKGEYLVARRREPGQPAEALLPDVVRRALGELPIPRRMRWGSSEAEFVRPVHWVVMLLGEDVVPCRVLDTDAGRLSRGHRFHSPGTLELRSADDYSAVLESQGRVVASFEERRDRVRAQAEAEARDAGGELVLDPGLLDEVTALVEWPVALCGGFEQRFLELPEEVLIATLQDHQRYFPVRGQDGRLLPRFVTISNLESRQPEAVRSGNERVVRPRLADAAFFWGQDRSRPLGERFEALDRVVFEKSLGSVGDKARRVKALAEYVAAAGGGDTALAGRAATLAKCDLLCEMVGEFPELQGTMGRYYAAQDGEPAEVAQAIEEHYLPRFAGDRLPATITGRILALADKLDTIAGIFAIGKPPTGNRDPFGVRRAALGVLRILIEGGMDLDLDGLVRRAVAAQPVETGEELPAQVFDYLMDRLRGFYAEGGAGLTAGHDAFEAVAARRPVSMTDFHQRLSAVVEFSRLDAAEALAGANKRIANILRQAGEPSGTGPDRDAMTEQAAIALHDAVQAAARQISPLIEQRRYREALEVLAGLREPVDTFFDDVLVMDPDPAIRANRLTLLASLRGLFMNIADVSRLGT